MRNTSKISFSLLFALFTMVSVSLHAQKKTSIIPKVGFNSSLYDVETSQYDNIDDYTETKYSRAGWNAGLDVRYGRYLYIQPGLHYSSNSLRLIDKEEITEGTLSFKDEARIQSLKVPVVVGAKIPVIGLRLQGGLTSNILLGINDPNDASATLDDFNTFNAAANVGIGWDLLGFLSLDLTYERGLTKYYQDADIKNNMVTLGVGIRL